ncbi:uncharacterized protein [Blastocystis hominis]|uniref:RING-type domain-containing protein n=1 Tax=Blastocystis hominis TaxID=12968 RepID=D8LX63_BLAHO|nr:uncharacterized protein [Blastocystis hominis]CBK20858.2 unnamed protein product [Blastocystis hominis]|eukprot:XP_012894906.1 uncharacterized protein [Blastocystis hominis]
MTESFESIAKRYVAYPRESNTTCSLCYEHPTDSRIEECTHRFCLACIWHNLKYGYPCPICRKEYHRIIKDDLGDYLTWKCISAEYPVRIFCFFINNRDREFFLSFLAGYTTNQVCYYIYSQENAAISTPL